MEIREFQRMNAAKYWAQQLDIPGYIQACCTMKLTFLEWIGWGDDTFIQRYGLPTPIKEALKRESRRIVEDQNRQREEEISKLKMDSQNVNRHSTLASGSNPLDRYFK